MIYPTGRAILLTVLGAPIGLALALGGGHLWMLGLAWTLAAAAAVLLDALLGADRRKTALEIQAPSALAMGAPAAARVRVRFDGRPAATVEVATQATPNLLVQPDRLMAKVVEGRADAAFQILPQRRGQGGLPRLWARWRGPMGLVFKQRTDACDYLVPINLDLGKIKADAARLLSGQMTPGARLQQDLGGASEFHALTDYQPGMDRRAIDWKQSARHRTLLAREFEAERNHHVIVAVDTGRQMCEPVGGVPRVDRALQAALLLAFGALKSGDRIGLFAFDERPRLWSGVLSGKGALSQLQGLAARLDYTTAETNYTLGLTALGGHLQRRSLIVVFTEFTDSTNAELMLEHLARLLRTHHVLFVALEDEELQNLERAPVHGASDVSKAVLAGVLARERELVIAKLRRMGADVLQTPAERLGPALVTRYVALKQGARL